MKEPTNNQTEELMLQVQESFEDDFVDMDEVRRLFKLASGLGPDGIVLVDESMAAMSVMEATPVLFRTVTPRQFIEATSDLRAQVLKQIQTLLSHKLS